jgi:hypothetical protein
MVGRAEKSDTEAGRRAGAENSGEAERGVLMQGEELGGGGAEAGKLEHALQLVETSESLTTRTCSTLSCETPIALCLFAASFIESPHVLGQLRLPHCSGAEAAAARNKRRSCAPPLFM